MEDISWRLKTFTLLLDFVKGDRKWKKRFSLKYCWFHGSSFKGFSIVFLLPDWLKLNHLKSRMECGFSDIFSRHFCSTVAETIGVTINQASFGPKKCSENHIWSCWDDSWSMEPTNRWFSFWGHDLFKVFNMGSLFQQRCQIEKSKFILHKNWQPRHLDNNWIPGRVVFYSESHSRNITLEHFYVEGAATLKEWYVAICFDNCDPDAVKVSKSDSHHKICKGSVAKNPTKQ